MVLLASFNYSGPSNQALLVGSVFGILAILGLAASRNVLLGLLGGGVCWGMIAFIVYGSGQGDMRQLYAVWNCVKFAPIGAAAGGITTFFWRAASDSTEQDVPARHDRSGIPLGLGILVVVAIAALVGGIAIISSGRRPAVRPPPLSPSPISQPHSGLQLEGPLSLPPPPPPPLR
ncbi:MAG: hypothetical protein U0790_24855 [Isosphaeraceae bacterium]